MSQAHQNGTQGRDGSSGGGLDDKHGHSGPSSELDIYDGVVNPSTADSIVAKLGTSYYTEDEQWQQISSYLKGMYGDAAFGRRLYERAVSETIQQLGERGCDIVSPDGENHTEMDGWDDWAETKQQRKTVRADEPTSPRTVIRERGEVIWDVLTETQQLIALQQHAGITGEWQPPQWRMMEARNEAAKSRDARTQDNLFGTRSSRKIREETDGAPKRLRKRRFGGDGR